MTTQAKPFLEEAIEAFRFAAWDYYTPLRRIGRWMRAVARLPEHMEKQERAVSELCRDIEKLRRELQEEAAAPQQAEKFEELKKVVTGLAEKEAFIEEHFVQSGDIAFPKSKALKKAATRKKTVKAK